MAARMHQRARGDASLGLVERARSAIGQTVSEQLEIVEAELRVEVDRMQAELQETIAQTQRLKAETDALLKSPVATAYEEARQRLGIPSVPSKQPGAEWKTWK